MRRISLVLNLLFLFVFISNICAQDWPQFLGPERNSTIPQKGILRSWPASGPELLWTTNVGPGFGGPVIKDRKVYNVTVYPGQWQQIIWEIPDLYRDKVTGISVSIMLSGSPYGASDRFKLYIDKLSIDEVSPEISRGFDLGRNSMAYCHSGYKTGSRKQALVQNCPDTRFQVLNEKGRVAFGVQAKNLKTDFCYWISALWIFQASIA